VRPARAGTFGILLAPRASDARCLSGCRSGEPSRTRVPLGSRHLPRYSNPETALENPFMRRIDSDRRAAIDR
jgi:hypothetical protein